MRRTWILLLAFLFAAVARSASAAGYTLADFTPLGASVAGGSLPESTPFLLSSPAFRQETINVNNAGAANGGVKLGDNWDMITLNENGPQAGRYLFAPYETGSAGVRRLDLQTGQAVSIVAPGTQNFVNGDASRWTPWGTYLTAEETTNGRLFEITNPLDAPGSINFVWRSAVPVSSYEGLVFDKFNNLYFGDEDNGGAVYKFTSVTPNNGATFFNAGQTFVLKVGAGGNTEATGNATWVPITDVNGNPLPGIPTVVVGGKTVVNARGAADVVLGTTFQRPEDFEIQNLSNGNQIIYFAPTTNSKVMSIDISNPNVPVVKLAASQATLDMATSLIVGSAFQATDNLAIDAWGNIYVVEDLGGINTGAGQGFDIWFLQDLNRDGVAESVGRWASLSTLGAEPTGLYFNPFNANEAFINVQHANSDLDRTIRITAIPEPATLSLLTLGAGGLAARRRRARQKKSA